ncbi:MAG: hypothetical protein HQL21_08990 [Candidatus Omnitrophica bacterium]|nr:hypothetical protein [Candidatus Omnitrophota bacterium]
MKRSILSIISAVFLIVMSGEVLADPIASPPITSPGCTQVCEPIPCDPGKICSLLVICKIVCVTDEGGSLKGSQSNNDGPTKADGSF